MAPPPQSESQTHWSDALPAYDNTGSSSYPDEKATQEGRPAAPCSKHGDSQTPHLDVELRQPKTQAVLRSLIATLNDALEGNRCTECTFEATAHTLTAYVTEMKAAKKDGQWSKEDKKALKAEAKAMGKRIKGSVKLAYKGKGKS